MIFGMKIYEFVTIIALVSGPVLAVLITLWSQKRISVRERQLQNLRMLLNTRHLAADPVYSVAINMVPIEFDGHGKIIAAWNSYIAAVHYKASQENLERHHQEMNVKQTQLIFEISKYLGYKISETQIQSSAYASQGFVDRERLSVDSQVAWIRIANALEGQNVAAGLPTPIAASELIPEQGAAPNPSS